jgi:hypothetical protein
MNFLDAESIQNSLKTLANHDRAQREYIQKLTSIIESAMIEMGSEDSDWFQEAKELMQFNETNRIDNENRRFHENTLRAQEELENPKRRHAKAIVRDVVQQDHEYDGELAQNDLAKYFKERPVKPTNQPNFGKMSLEQIEEWERKQENSNDIYKIKARVANLARGGGASLTPQGEMLCNTYVHVLKSFYDFADRIPDREMRLRLIELIKSNEGMPANLINAAGAGVKS